MRKCIILLFTLLLLSLTACGSVFSESDGAWPAPAMEAPASAPHGGVLRAATVTDTDSWDVTDEVMLFYAEEAGTESEPPPESEAEPAGFAERIIHHASAEVETDSFDQALDQVYSLIEQHRGFLQWADVSGRNFYAQYHKLFVGRQANFTIRVPIAQYHAMLQDIENLGAMTYLTTRADNVSAQYADITSRLTALRTQEARILALFEEAENLAEILDLEDRLSQVIFQIERLSGDRDHIDNLVTYSTIQLSLREVEEMADLNPPPPEPDPGFFEELGTTFIRQLQGMGRALQNFVIWLVMVLPWLVLIAVIVSVPLFICLRKFRKFRNRNRQESTPSDD